MNLQLLKNLFTLSPMSEKDAMLMGAEHMNSAIFSGVKEDESIKAISTFDEDTAENSLVNYARER